MAETTQCRLCLANIPHDIEHALELRSSFDSESLHSGIDWVEELGAARLRGEWKLDWGGMACLAYVLTICEATAFIIFLILLKVQDDALHPMPWGLGGIGMTAVVMGIHFYFLFRLPKSLKWRRVCCAVNFLATVFWGGLMVWAVVHLQSGRRLESA
jgi:hypothetical protein